MFVSKNRSLEFSDSKQHCSSGFGFRLWGLFSRSSPLIYLLSHWMWKVMLLGVSLFWFGAEEAALEVNYKLLFGQESYNVSQQCYKVTETELFAVSQVECLALPFFFYKLSFKFNQMSAVLKAKLYKEFIIFNYNLKLKFLGIGGLVWVCGLVCGCWFP